MGDNFDSGGGEQNSAKGNHAIGEQVNNHGPVISTTGDQSPAVNAQGNVNITYGVPFEKYEQVRDECERLKVEYGIKDAAFVSFFKILEQESIPCAEWGAKLPEIAFRHKELLLRFEAVTSDDPQVQSLKDQAGQAIDNGEYDRADALLNQAKERDRAAVATLRASIAEQQAALEKRQLSEAASCVDQADLQRLQYRYEKSARYYQEAAAALPEGYEWGRADCLNAAGNDLHSIASYADALRLYKQSLFISREIGDRKGEAKLLSNIGSIFQAQGDYGNALDYLEQSLPICLELGDKKGECTTMNNIATIYLAKGDHSKSLKYFERNIKLVREMHDKEGEGGTLTNIGTIHHAQGNYATALQYFKQALAISRKIKHKRMESMCLNNIGQVYKAQEDYDAALKYAEQSLAISQHIGDRRGEGTTLNQIGMIYKAKGDYPAALKQYEQALAIAKEIGDKDGESAASGNIGVLLIKQGEVAKAEPYLSRAVELEEQLEHPLLEEHRKGLEAVRATLRGQQTRQP
jgi:tetratricopeptide (TPR) repeat protein